MVEGKCVFSPLGSRQSGEVSRESERENRERSRGRIEKSLKEGLSSLQLLGELIIFCKQAVDAVL